MLRGDSIRAMQQWCSNSVVAVMSKTENAGNRNVSGSMLGVWGNAAVTAW